jgi:hypothetical protein
MDNPADNDSPGSSNEDVWGLLRLHNIYCLGGQITIFFETSPAWNRVIRLTAVAQITEDSSLNRIMTCIQSGCRSDKYNPFPIRP